MDWIFGSLMLLAIGGVLTIITLLSDLKTLRSLKVN
jgi:hypothetical protein